MMESGSAVQSLGEGLDPLSLGLIREPPYGKLAKEQTEGNDAEDQVSATPASQSNSWGKVR